MPVLSSPGRSPYGFTFPVTGGEPGATDLLPATGSTAPFTITGLQFISPFSARLVLLAQDEAGNGSFCDSATATTAFGSSVAAPFGKG